uniref:NAD(P)H-quinone oxidoreductase subunit 2, chloroplastic n=1 Tax=Lomariopsis japurensis TaxID=373558 RepID=A0A5B9RDD2_9MONI|nr:NADH-plastoquinone oxidoreductase subunit 2 [Lomariopsis japurensis]QEG57413.1 NADH-plastoquinone oxidoreductase subunit 2 [Lomariopsis japurensis]
MNYTNFTSSGLFLLFGNPSTLPERFLIFGLITVIVIDLANKGKNTIWLYQISLISILIGMIASLCQWQIQSVYVQLNNNWINNFSSIFRFLLLICSLLCVLLSVDYVRCSKMSLAEFLFFVLTAGSGGMVLCWANDLITLYVALESLSLSSCFLSGYAKRDVRSNEATTKFLLMSGASSSLLLYGFSLLYGISGGQLQLDKIAGELVFSQSLVVIFTAIAFSIAGTAFKLSLVPFHQWTPDVYEGVSPIPVVAFFSVTSKVAAPALFTRLFGLIFSSFSNDWHIVVGLLATSSMILGNLIAVTQISMKRMLAYPSISQIGYIMIGVLAADSENGYASMITYTFIYILMNLGTFARITSFGLRTGTDNIRDYAGLYMKDPVLTFSPVVRSPSLGGIPPPSGFFGKLYLFWHGWKAGSYPSVLVALVTSVISIYYYLKIIKLIFTGKNGRNDAPTTYIRNSLVSPSISKSPIEIAMIICALASILSGILIDPIIGITRNTLF